MLFVKVVLASFRCQHFGALFSETVRVPEGALPDVILKQARIASRRFDKDDNVLWFETLQGWTTTFKATQQRSTTYFCPLYFDPNKHVLVRMLVNPSDPHFGHHEVFVKQHGLQVIRESMARLTADEFVFVGKDWALPLKSQRVGYLFTIHLVDCLALSTRHVKYTLTPDVKEELRKIVGNRTIEKGGGNFTFEQFFPRIKRLLHDLVFDERDHNGEEILVSSRGTFYKSSALNIKGFRNKTPHDLVTWYKTDDFTQPSKRKRL